MHFWMFYILLLVGSAITTCHGKDPVNVAVDGVNYFTSGNKMTWISAFKFCQASGGHMAILDTPGHWNNIVDAIPNEKYWLGLIFIEHQYFWVNGSRASYDDLTPYNWRNSISDKNIIECAYNRNEDRKPERLDTMDCEKDDVYALCQSGRIQPEYFERFGNLFIFSTKQKRNYSASREFCNSMGSKIIEHFDNADLVNRLAKYTKTGEVDTYFVNVVDSAAGTSYSVISTSLIADATLSGSEHGVVCAVDETSFVYLNGTYIKYHGSKSMTYHEANAQCQDEDGLLITIRDPLQHAILTQNIQTTDWWIGYNGGSWETPSLSSPWYAPTRNDDCIIMNKLSDFTFSDKDCDADQAAFICQNTDIPDTCKKPLGMESGEITDEMITASSEFSATHSPFRARLNYVASGFLTSAWCKEFSDTSPWLQVKLGTMKNITHISTQGGVEIQQWVKIYQIAYGTDPSSLKFIRDDHCDGLIHNFTGNIDSNSVVTNEFPFPVIASHIRIYPLEFRHNACLRIELLGCDVEGETPTCSESTTTTTYTDMSDGLSTTEATVEPTTLPSNITTQNGMTTTQAQTIPTTVAQVDQSTINPSTIAATAEFFTNDLTTPTASSIKTPPEPCIKFERPGYSIYKSDAISIKVLLKFECEIVKNKIYRWYMRSCDDLTNTELVNFNTNVAIFDKSFFTVGFHKIMVNFTENDNLTSAAEVQLDVLPSLLYAYIDGGNERTIGHYEEVTFDGSKSSDPDGGKLTFEWRHSINDGPFTNLTQLSPAFGSTYVTYSIKQDKFSLNWEEVGISTGTLVSVQLVVFGSYGRKKIFTQKVVSIVGTPPNANIICKLNCMDMVVSTIMESSFEIQTGGDEVWEYSWSLLNLLTFDMLDLNSDISNNPILIPTNLLRPEQKYLLRCEIMNSFVKANYSIEIWGGSIPSNGRWDGSMGSSSRELSTFDYSFYLGSDLLTFSTNGISENHFLAVPEFGDDQTITIFICNYYRSCANVNITVTVIKLEVINSTEMLRDLGNSPYYLDKIASYLSVLRVNIPDNGNETREALLDILVELHENTTISIPSVWSNNIQYATILSAITKVDSELTEKSEQLAAGLSQVVMSQMVEIENMPPVLSKKIADEVIITTSNLLSAVHVEPPVGAKEGTLDTSSTTQFKPLPDDEADLSPMEIMYKRKQEVIRNLEPKSETEYHTRSMANVLVSTTNLLQEAIEPGSFKLGADVKTLSSPGFHVEVQIISEDHPVKSASPFFNSVAVHSESADTKSTELAIKSFKENPFGFESSSTLINSPITQLQLLNKNADFVKIVIKNNPDDTRKDELIITPNVATVSKFELIDGSAIMLSLDLNLPPREDTSVALWMRHGRQPTLMQFSEDPSVKIDIFDYFWIWENVSSADELFVFVSEENTKGSGVYYTTMLVKSAEKDPLKRRRKREAEDIEATISLHTPSCKIWDDVNEKWISGICRATIQSNSNETHCTCTNIKKNKPLTIGVQFFKPPNQINFATVWSKVDVIGNGSVFWTITFLIALYLILVVWTRRQDKEDSKQWSIKYLEDNKSTDWYYYIVSVVTGIAQNSGTDSNVYFIVTGEKHETVIRGLSDGSDEKLLQTGSINNYLLAVPNCLGPLCYLQIWHDSSGHGLKGRSWLLSEIVITDVQLDQSYYFYCNEWLAGNNTRKLLPVCGEDNLTEYKRVVSGTIKKNLVEGHLWISVFVNHSYSTFTRLERLSCCFAVVFLGLIANAMFYQTDNTTNVQSRETTVITLGPIKLDPYTIYVSVISCLVVLPASFLLVTLFQRKGRRNNSKVQNENFLQVVNSKKDKEEDKSRQLPYWIVYVAWILFIISMLASSFFTILYSFEWGKEKSDNWLVSIVLSVVEDSLIVRPIKIFVLSFVIASITRKPVLIEEVHKIKEINIMVSCDTGMVTLLASVYTYVLDNNFYRITTHFKSILLVEDKLEKVSTQESFNAYLKNNLLPAIYPTHNYNGNGLRWFDRANLADGVNFRVGFARLRQLRMKTRNCEVKLHEYDNHTCTQLYDRRNSMKQNYTRGWESIKTFYGLFSSEWDYIPMPTDDMGEIEGEFSTYPPTGYAAELGVTYDSSLKIINSLQTNNWLDRYTQAALIEFSTYNTNSRIFMFVTILAEFPPSSAAYTRCILRPFRLYKEDSSFEIFINVSLFIMCITYIGIMINECTQKESSNEQQQMFWVIFNLIRVLLVLGYLLLSLVTKQEQKKALNKFHENTYAFVDFRQLTYLSEVVKKCAAWAVFMEMLHSIEFIQHTKYCGLVARVLTTGTRAICMGALVLVLVTFAHALTFTILLSAYLLEFRTTIHSILQLWTMMLGVSTYHNITEVSPVFGRIFYFSYGACITTTALNFLLAIFDAVLHELNETEDNAPPTMYFEVALNIFVTRFKQFVKRWKRTKVEPIVVDLVIDETESLEAVPEKWLERKPQKIQKIKQLVPPKEHMHIDCTKFYKQAMQQLDHVGKLIENLSDVEEDLPDIDEDTNPEKRIILSEVHVMFGMLDKSLYHL